MKENYQIHIPYQFHWKPHTLDWDPQLPHKKMKTLFLWNMSKSRRLTSTFSRSTARRTDITGCRVAKHTTDKKRQNKKVDVRISWYSSLLDREKSRSQSSTFWHIREKQGFYFLMRKLGISTKRMRLPIKLIGYNSL